MTGDHIKGVMGVSALCILVVLATQSAVAWCWRRRHRLAPSPAPPSEPKARKRSPTERAINSLRFDLYFVAIVIIAAVLVLKLS